MSTLASPGFIIGPAAAWVALFGAAMLMPLGPAGSALAFKGDVILLVYLLALARFCTAWAAMETGSAFEGMGAAREVSFAVLAEAAVIAAMLSLSVQTGSVSLITMLSPSTGAGAVLLAAGLFTVLLAENCRVPFDDPNTHLELTMIHEVMVLDHSGVDLALIQYASALKFAMYGMLIANFFFAPAFSLLAKIAVYLVVQAVFAVIIGLLESFRARFRMRHNPQFIFTLTSIAVLVFFAVLIIMENVK